MSRTTEKQPIDKEDIKARWEEIFRSKLSLKTNGNKLVGLCPFHVENTPSFNVFEGGAWNCFGCGKNGGDVIQFIMELEGKTFIEAITNIKDEFHFDRLTLPKKKPFRIPILYEFNAMPFNKQHHKYWNRYWMSEDFVSSVGDIYAVKSWAINKKKQEITEGEIVFAYVFKNEDGLETGELKLLRIGPLISKMEKWRTNVSNTRLWYTYKYKGLEIPQLFIAKSNKDSLVNIMAEIPSISTQSENDIILSKNIPYLKTICPNLVLNFGSDPQGANASINVSKEWDLPWFNTPKRYLKDGINDNAEYQAEFGPDCFKQLLKDKNYL